MSRNRKQKNNTRSKTGTFITGAVFALAILVVIICIMSGALKFEAPKAEKEEITPSPEVTAPVTVPEPSPTEPIESDEPVEPMKYTVTVFAGHGGSADPAGTSTVEEGNEITVYFRPDPGFYVSTVTVNGELVEIADSYTISDISENMTIDVGFDTVSSTDLQDDSLSPYWN